MIFDTQESLDAALAEWQDVLRLRDWQVRAKIVGSSDLGACKAGDCNWCAPKKEAIIRLVHPIDYQNFGVLGEPQDHEKTLVHELIHLHLSPIDDFEDDSLQHVALEQATELLANALVRVKRQARP